MSMTTTPSFEPPPAPLPVLTTPLNHAVWAAWGEGWAVVPGSTLNDGSPRVELRRVDPRDPTTPAFAADHDVWEHVVAQARAGSLLHRGALRKLDRIELMLIEASCGSW